MNGLQEGYDILKHSHWHSFWLEQIETSLTWCSHSLFGGKHESQLQHPMPLLWEDHRMDPSIAWPPLSLQENAPEGTGFIMALAMHQHIPAVHGTAQPPAQWRGMEVSLPLQVFINSLLIWSINSWTSGKTELFNPKILKANIFLSNLFLEFVNFWK